MSRLVQRFAPAGAAGEAENARNLAKEGGHAMKTNG